MIILTSLLGFFNKKTVLIVAICVTLLAFLSCFVYIYIKLQDCSEAGLQQDIAVEMQKHEAEIEQKEFEHTQKNRTSDLEKLRKNLEALNEKRKETNYILKYMFFAFKMQ